MRKILIFAFSIFILISCSGKEEAIKPVLTEEEGVKIYNEALELADQGQYFMASKKFDEAESLFPNTRLASKAALMSGYCMYSINFYDDAIDNLERFKKIYPASEHLDYVHYLVAIIYYEQILDEKKDIQPLLLSKKEIELFLEKYPNTEYAIDLKFKLDLIINQLAAKELSIARYYIKNEKWIAAINRLKFIVEEYDQTIFIEEALHRLVEIYYKIGLEGEARATASLLGYNYNSSEWYERSYKVLNKTYKSPKIEKANKEGGLVKRTLKKILFIYEK